MHIALEQRGLWSRIRPIWVALALTLALLFAASPALAHKDHKKKPAEAAQMMRPGAQPGAPMAMNSASAANAHQQGMQAEGDAMMQGMGMDRSKMSFFERLFGWLGRLHPLIVHFPIAFFPAALLTAIAGRKKPSFAAPVQFLVVAGGIFAPLAAAAGWLAGMAADPEPILTYHRWLGVAVGLGGASLGVWAWKRPWEDRGTGMIAALSVMTIAIAAQGFMGAALTHGMDHMMF